MYNKGNNHLGPTNVRNVDAGVYQCVGGGGGGGGHTKTNTETSSMGNICTLFDSFMIMGNQTEEASQALST